MSGRIEKLVGEKPFRPVTVRVQRDYFETIGKENWMVTLVPVGGGYRFHVHPAYGHKQTNVICSEKSRKVRIFKTVESALRLAKSYGFTSVAVELVGPLAEVDNATRAS